MSNTPHPVKGVLYGITHTPEGLPIIRQSRVLKVGIGHPKGRSIHVWINKDDQWAITFGKKVDSKLTNKTATFKTMAEAKAGYEQLFAQSDDANYPRKLPYFTFTRQVLRDGVEVFEPAWEAIEQHGHAPTEIDILFTTDDPLDGQYQMWSTAELQCHGDGLTAARVVSLGKGEPEAEGAKRNGDRTFPIINKCWLGGCEYSKERQQGSKVIPSPCKPGGDLRFQLARHIRIGATAYFHTSGLRSIGSLFSAIEDIKSLTGGRIAGIPLKLVLRPYKTKHNGQVATQYGVSLEFRAEDMQEVQEKLINQAWKFRQALPAPSRLIEAATDALVADEDEDLPVTPAGMVAEFYPETVEEETPAPSVAEVKTAEKTTALAEKLKARRETTQPITETTQPITETTQPITETTQPITETEDLF